MPNRFNGHHRPRPSLPASILAAVISGTLLLVGCGPVAQTPSTPQSEGAASAITIKTPWARETSKGQDAGGVFLSITNEGSVADRLIGGSTPIAGRVEIHTMSMDGEVMRMRKLPDGLELPSGNEVTLKPGSFHVMLMELKRPLKAGESVPVNLIFERAGTVRTDVVVQPAGALEHHEGERDQ